MRDTFRRIYQHNEWGSDESVSGRGSTLKATEDLRRSIRIIVDKLEIETIVDAACGDAGWWHEMVFDHRVRYLGVDIVPELVEQNKAWYGEFGSRRQTTDQFAVMDITRDPLPPADLIFARDVLVHFSNADVTKALVNVKNSHAKYFMATTFPEHENSGDMKTGEWRPLNLEQMWGLGKPIEVINEFCGIPGYLDKSMAIWRLR